MSSSRAKNIQTRRRQPWTRKPAPGTNDAKRTERTDDGRVAQRLDHVDNKVHDDVTTDESLASSDSDVNTAGPYNTILPLERRQSVKHMNSSVTHSATTRLSSALTDYNTPNEMTAHKMCVVCKHKDVEARPMYSFCTDCAFPLCKPCHDQHKETRVTQDHTLAVVAKQRQPATDIAEETGGSQCAEHAELPVEYFCEDCGAFCCVTCTMITHSEHALLKVDEKSDRSLSDIKRSKQGIERRIAYFSDEVSRIETLQEAMTASRSAVTSDLRQAVSNIRQMLEREEKKLAEKADQYFDNKADLLTEKRIELETTLEEAGHLLQSCERCVLEEDKINVITGYMAMEDDIAKLQTVHGVSDGDFPTLSFRSDNNLKLGSVDILGREPYHRRESQPSNHVTNRDNKEMGKRGSGVDFSEYAALNIVAKFKTQHFIQEPTDIVVLPNGRLVLSDGRNHGLVFCERSGRFQERLLLNEVTAPAALALTPDGQLAVAADNVIKTFSQKAVKLSQFKVPAIIGSMVVDVDGLFIVADIRSYQIYMLDEAGHIVKKFPVDDDMKIGPEPYNMAVKNECIALCYRTSHSKAHSIKIYSYTGALMRRCVLSTPCLGLLMDHLGNIMAAGGDITYLPATDDCPRPLPVSTKIGKPFKVLSKCLTVTPDGQIVTVHYNPAYKRCDVLLLASRPPGAVTSQIPRHKQVRNGAPLRGAEASEARGSSKTHVEATPEEGVENEEAVVTLEEPREHQPPAPTIRPARVGRKPKAKPEPQTISYSGERNTGHGRTREGSEEDRGTASGRSGESETRSQSDEARNTPADSD